MQGRFQDLKQEAYSSGARTNICLANLGDVLKNLAQKGVGVRAPPLDPRLQWSLNEGNEINLT